MMKCFVFFLLFFLLFIFFGIYDDLPPCTHFYLIGAIFVSIFVGVSLFFL